MRHSRSRHSRRRSLRLAVVVTLVLIANVPVLAVIVNSFKSTQEFVSTTSLLPQHWTLANYTLLGVRINYPSLVATSLTLALGTALLSMVVAALAGYSLSRSRSRVLHAYARSTLIMQMFPHVLTLVPMFVLFASFHLINTLWSVLPLYVGAVLPYGIWVAKSFFDSIPRDLEEAAWVDGCSVWRGFVRVVLPLSRPGLAAVGIYAFLLSWNEFLFASVFLRNPDQRTIPVGIFSFVQEYLTEWGPLFAASSVAVIPALLFVVFAQRYMVQGALNGSVKG